VDIADISTTATIASVVVEGIRMPSQDPTPPPLSEADQRQILELYQQIRRRGAHWVGPDGRSESLAATLSEFMAKLNTRLSEGQWVALGQNVAQLTPAAAARLLGVSRQFLIGQLKEREIPFHRVGAHYRFYLKDVLAYQMQRDNQWRRVPDALPLAEAVEDRDDRELPDNLKLAPLLDPDPPLQETPVSLPPVLADLSAAGVEEVLDDSISGAPGAPDPCALESGASVERPADLKPEPDLTTTPIQPATPSPLEVQEGFDDRDQPDDFEPAVAPPLPEPPAAPLLPIPDDLSAAKAEEGLNESVPGAPESGAVVSHEAVSDPPDSDAGVSGISVERPVDLKPERQLELTTTPTQPAPTSVQLAPPSQSGQAPEPVPAASAESVPASSEAAEELEARRWATELLGKPVDARTMARLESAAQLDPRGEINSVKPGTLLLRLKTASKLRVDVNSVDELVRWIISQNWHLNRAIGKK
jgi:excisionase family DNA binding protein